MSATTENATGALAIRPFTIEIPKRIIHRACSLATIQELARYFFSNYDKGGHFDGLGGAGAVRR
jgi:hypothetical protein